MLAWIWKKLGQDVRRQQSAAKEGLGESIDMPDPPDVFFKKTDWKR